MSARARVLAFDPSRTPEDTLPASVLDLTDPEYEGRVGVAPPNASFQDWVGALRVEIGDEATSAFLEGLVANDVQTYPNNIAIVDAIDRGEIDYGLVNHYYVLELKEQDPDLAVENHFFPADDPGSLVLVSGVAVLDSTERSRPRPSSSSSSCCRPRPRSTWPTETREFPLAGGVEPVGDLPPLADVAAGTVDLAALGDGVRHDAAADRGRRPGAAERRAMRSPGRRTSASRSGALLAVAAAAFAAPVAYLVVEAAGDPAGTWDAVTDADVLGPLRRTLVLAVVVTVLATVLGVGDGVVLCPHRRRRAARRCASPPCCPLVIPSFVAANALVSAFAPGGLLEQALGWERPPRDARLRGAVIVLTLADVSVRVPAGARPPVRRCRRRWRRAPACSGCRRRRHVPARRAARRSRRPSPPGPCSWRCTP